MNIAERERDRERIGRWLPALTRVWIDRRIIITKVEASRKRSFERIQRELQRVQRDALHSTLVVARKF